ncbi:MAG: hypothetical protein NTX81_08940 [Candidatus Bathyarchaeota archaeon]|jgi:hypothetical protein|nr:hypothetical protein [Candidatus Bathyarchaeota archaeon]
MSTEKVEFAEQFDPTTPEVCEICGKPTPRIELWDIYFCSDEPSRRKIKVEDDWFEYFDICSSCYQKVRSIAESEPEHVNLPYQYCYFCYRPTPDGYGWNIVHEPTYPEFLSHDEYLSCIYGWRNTGVHIYLACIKCANEIVEKIMRYIRYPREETD